MTRSQAFRLAAGGFVDRARPLRFTFDGRPMTGYAGDTLASALLANGVRLLGRSFKYHRPRGLLSAGPEEPNALVELRKGARREPNTKATTVELFDGLEAASQNRWPSLRLDLLSLNSALAPLLPAGFYYKTFMWPRALWERLYEPVIRRAAGLGRAADGHDPDHYEQAYAFCDVLVVGAGPAGLAAALAAGRAGARVILCEEDARLGGRLLSEDLEIDGLPAHVWAEEAVRELSGLAGVRIMPRTAVFGVFDGGTYGALERVTDHLPVPPAFAVRQRLWRIVARRTILASGAIERPVAFAGNDRPGVMLAGAVRTYLNRFAVAPGRRLVLFTSSDDGWRTAAAAARAGMEVAAIVDARAAVPPAVMALAPRGATVHLDARVREALGGRALAGVALEAQTGRQRIAADLLAVSGGWNPNFALASHHGARAEWCPHLVGFAPSGAPDGMVVAGAARGMLSLARCLADGWDAGATGSETLGFRPVGARAFSAEDEPSGVSALWHVKGGRAKAFVDLQNDVTVSDVLLAEREGYRSAEHLKRYTTLGMATDQGKTGNVLALGILAETRGAPVPSVGITRFRPPAVPVAIGALAGRHRGREFRPTRLTPTHAWAQSRGAVFVEAGPWLRAQYYPMPGETDWLETVGREVLTVRRSVGFCDVSTLGKIDVQGPDAGLFLDRLYINTFSTLPVGRARYGIMLREDGFVMDDGTTARLAPDRYYVTTTTANAVRVFQHMQFCHQVLWPDLDVQLVSVSDQWAKLSVAGPKARETLRGVVDAGSDLSSEALPHMGVAEISVMDGIAARIFRLSFSGELAFEVAVPAGYGAALAARLMQAGAAFGITPYGTEALGVMRIEKGHIGGNEIDGRTTAADLGLARMMSRKKDFIGRVLAERPALTAPGRMQLVGLRPLAAGARLRAGAHFLAPGAPAHAGNDEGVMTSVAFSPLIGSWIGLGLLKSGPSRLGQRVRAYDPVRGGDVEVEVVQPCFLDPSGERLHV
ncbi:MAG: sarcosine oxidase subunit alpha family protein [Hyphomicrobiaceae bacterium]|nr:sarcosine oxidase subunit alpha family protein [Hyphomicrobiaceae bacterium]